MAFVKAQKKVLEHEEDLAQELSNNGVKNADEVVEDFKRHLNRIADLFNRRLKF